MEPRIVVEVTEEMHTEIKMLAIKHRKTIKEVVTVALERFLASKRNTN